MKPDPLQRPCPVCDHSRGEILHHQKMKSSPYEMIPAEYDVVACEQCGMVFVDTPTSQEDYDRYYSELCSKYSDMNTGTGTGESADDLSRFGLLADCLLEAGIPQDAEIVDVGCGSGGFLKILKEKGYTNLCGIDPTPECIRNLEKLGFKGLVGVFNEESLSGKTFDCVVSTGVLEHIRDLKPFMQALAATTSPEGSIVVEVPDASKYETNYVSPFYHFDCEHINHFDPVSLRRLFADIGFGEVVLKQNEQTHASGIPFGLLHGVFSRRVPIAPPEVGRNKESIRRYVEKSANVDWSELERLATSQEPVVVWGIGAFALWMLENSPLGRCNIQFFVDANASKQGSVVAGLTIHSPEKLKEFEGTVVVGSAMYTPQIVQTIEKMNRPGKTLTLR